MSAQWNHKLANNLIRAQDNNDAMSCHRWKLWWKAKKFVNSTYFDGLKVHTIIPIWMGREDEQVERSKKQNRVEIMQF